MESIALSALANPIRLQLIVCIKKCKGNVAHMVDHCGLSQSAVSQHLNKLYKAGLVTTHKKGKEIYYALAHPRTLQISQMLQQFIEDLEKKKGGGKNVKKSS